MKTLDIPFAYAAKAPLIAPSLFYINIDKMSTTVNKPRYKGNGYLTGQAPNGLVTLNGEPIVAHIRIIYRATSDIDYTDGALIAETISDENGEWLITGLNPDLKYDVVSRLDGYNDIIVSNVSPSV